eukprot:3938084-Rhodomonas_salina.2
MPRATYVAVGEFCGMPVYAMLFVTEPRKFLIVVGQMNVERDNLLDIYKTQMEVSQSNYTSYDKEYRSRVNAFSAKLQRQDIPEGGGCLEFYTDENAVPLRFQGKLQPHQGWQKTQQVHIWKQADWVLMFAKEAPEFVRTQSILGRLSIRYSVGSSGFYDAPDDKYRVGDRTPEMWLQSVRPMHQKINVMVFTYRGFVEFIDHIYTDRGGFDAFAEKRVDGMQALEEPWKQAPPESTA